MRQQTLFLPYADILVFQLSSVAGDQNILMQNVRSGVVRNILLITTAHFCDIKANL